jgi:arginase
VAELRLIVVPYELGRLRDGVGRGPERLLDAGAEAALATSGARVRRELVELDRPFDRTGLGDVDACFELIRLVAERVRLAAADGAFPIVLSGSCFASIGVVAGLAEPAPGVAWLDAHGDFNSPDTTISGYFDGMGLAVLTGSAWQGMLANVHEARPVPESAAVLAGARDFDPPEEQRLSASAITHLPVDRMRAPEALVRAVGKLTPKVTGLYLHVDLDVLDREVAHVNVYGASGGLNGGELQHVVATVCNDCPVRAVSLTAYDPDFDTDGRVPPIALNLLRTIGDMIARHERIS